MGKSFSNFVVQCISTQLYYLMGVCNLCNGAVQFVIKRDNKNQFLFASLQSEEGKQILEQHNFLASRRDSFFLVDDGKVYERSTAALRVLKT